MNKEGIFNAILKALFTALEDEWNEQTKKQHNKGNNSNVMERNSKPLNEYLYEYALCEKT